MTTRIARFLMIDAEIRPGQQLPRLTMGVVFASGRSAASAYTPLRISKQALIPERRRGSTTHPFEVALNSA
jgi:hypothetical protein